MSKQSKLPMKRARLALMIIIGLLAGTYALARYPANQNDQATTVRNTGIATIVLSGIGLGILFQTDRK
jgi:hypothetical protein